MLVPDPRYNDHSIIVKHLEVKSKPLCDIRVLSSFRTEKVNESIFELEISKCEIDYESDSILLKS